MAKDAFDARGLADAQLITMALKAMTAAEAGADWTSDERTPYPGKKKTPTNKEIIEYLAEPNHGPSRDIRITDSDGDELNRIVANEMTEALIKVGNTGMTKRRVTVAGGKTKLVDDKAFTVTAEKQARAGITGGLRKAAIRAADIQYDRVKNMKTNDGSAAAKVSGSLDVDSAFGGGGGYAGWRYRTFGVNEDVVYFASGQLARALQTSSLKGKIKIRYNAGKTGKVLASVKGSIRASRVS
jgi:hypothetical protein